jgi:hypothetical protein
MMNNNNFVPKVEVEEVEPIAKEIRLRLILKRIPFDNIG